MDLQETLKKFGIEKKEAKIYLASSELGIATAQEIAKKAGVFRTYFYDIAHKLTAAGLLKQIKKGKKTFFLATEPEDLVRIEEQKLKELKQAIPQLKAIYNAKGQKPKVYYYEGRTGIDKINDDSLRYPEKEVQAFTTPRFLTAEQKKLARDYIERRVATKIKARVIGEESKEIRAIKSRDKKELRDTKILPKKLFSSEIELGIYSDKVYIINYKSEFGLVIEDKDTASVLKQIFEIVWKS
ncbi:MAG: helix-turn-helix domain-containing protein [Candidatus Moraniibacteriota bacterium]